MAMESFTAYSLELMSKGSPCDITRAASELHARADELLKFYVTPVDYCVPVIKFVPMNIDELTERVGGGQNVIGRVVISNSDQFDTSAEELHLQTERERELERSSAEMEQKIQQLEQKILELEKKPQMQQQPANSGLRQTLQRPGQKKQPGQMQYMYELDITHGHLVGVTQLHDVVYVVCAASSAISRFDATTHQRLRDINIKDLKWPRDIAACQQTSQVYVVYLNVKPGYFAFPVICRVSADGSDIRQSWLLKLPHQTSSSPLTLSVTATRLVVTMSEQLIEFNANGAQLRHVSLPQATHAVESPAGILIVSHYDKETKTNRVSLVNTGGQVVRQSWTEHPLCYVSHMAVDSKGNIFVADRDKHCIFQLDAQLQRRGVLVNEHQLKHEQPVRLCYVEQSGQLLVGLADRASVAVFNVKDLINR